MDHGEDGEREQQWKVAKKALLDATDAWHAALFSVPGYEGWNFEPDDLRRVLDESPASESLLKVLGPAEQEITRILNALVLNFVEIDEKWRTRRALCSDQGFTQGKIGVCADSILRRALRETSVFSAGEIDEHVYQLEDSMPKVIEAIEEFAQEGNFRFGTTLMEKARSLTPMSWELICDNLPPREAYEAFFGYVRTILSILSYNVCRIQAAFRLFGAENAKCRAEGAADLDAELARQVARKKRSKVPVQSMAYHGRERHAPKEDLIDRLPLKK